MIKTLRKRHLQIWAVLAVLIPAGILAAVVTRPEPATGKLLQADTSAALPVLLKSIDKEGYTANLRCNADTSSLQLEWINKKIITVPSALVYQGHLHGNEFGDTTVVFLGRIASTGTYYFTLEKTALASIAIRLDDIVKRAPIDSFQFYK